MEIVVHHPFSMNGLNDNAAEVLQQAYLLDVKYWLGGGTVLGLYRDNNFIANDTDIDIEVQGFGSIFQHLKDLYPHMQLIRTVHHQGKPMQVAFLYKDVIFDVYVFWENGETMINHNDMGVMEIPKRFYEELEIIETRYGDFPVPSPIEDYLVIRYGADWQTPANHKGLYTHAI